MDVLVPFCLVIGLFLTGVGHCMFGAEDWFYGKVSMRAYSIIETIFSFVGLFLMICGLMIIAFPLIVNGL